MNQKQFKILLKIIIRLLLIFLIIMVASALIYLKFFVSEDLKSPETIERFRKYQKQQNETKNVTFNGVSIKLPVGWISKEQVLEDGQAFQISIKKNDPDQYIGQVITFLKGVTLDKYELNDFNDIIENYKNDNLLQNLNFSEVEQDYYSDIRCPVLKYSFELNGVKMYGTIYQFNYKNNLFIIVQKSTELIDVNLKSLENSFKVTSDELQ